MLYAKKALACRWCQGTRPPNFVRNIRLQQGQTSVPSSFPSSVSLQQGQVSFRKRSYVSVARETFFTQRKHQKHCPRCGKPNLLQLERCNFCNTEMPDDVSIADAKPCDLVEAVLTHRYHGRPVLDRQWDVFAVEHRYPCARAHLLVFPKTRLEDLLQCQRKDLPLLRKLFETGVKHLREVYNVERNFICGFSYPSEYQQLALHVIAPPIRNFRLFRTSNWFFYRDAYAEIARTGRITKKPDPQATNIDATVERIDAAVRRGGGGEHDGRLETTRRCESSDTRQWGRSAEKCTPEGSSSGQLLKHTG
ncbi:unnamed protein product [Amoebophrya sp. A120]|nr:unnamed protein product [Amoebophrya sp. A120]|eukprot:GSA120T00023065001.1